MSNLIGQTLGRYHILEQLGEGGMATVYKAYDTRLESEVAVKVIRTDELPQKILSRALQRFEREAKALAKLNHLNIVKVIDYGEYEGSPYLVMPYLSGGTLKQKLAGRALPWQEVIKTLLPIARALDYAHRQNMIHRDVKPSNILITSDGDPLLTDFGIAKIIDEEATLDLTGTSSAVGTPEYMAPEQVTSKNVDHRADIYALGIVFYEMVTGRKPYTADTPMAILFKHASEPLPRPKSFVPSLPDRVEQTLIKALAKKTEDRYQTMAEFAKALEGLLESKEIRGKIIPPKNKETPDPEKRAVTKLPAIPRGAVITIGLIALGIGLVVIFLSSLKSLPARLLPTAIASNTPTLEFTSTPKSTTASLFTATPAPTNTPLVSPTPTLGIGSIWVRPADGMVMVYVPEGEFTMGSNDGPDDERPAHQVYLDAYWIDRTEVTNAMFAKCVADGACKNAASSVRASNYANYPVEGVYWDDAQIYCKWVEAHLPTEAEWEKAARGTDGRIYPWGKDKDITRYYLSPYNQNLIPVGSYPSGASPYGALDMAGSVSEWVFDWYSSTYYQTSPSLNPRGPADGDRHILRGGTWFALYGSSFRNGLRAYYSPYYSGASLGFRCARSISP